MYLFHIIFHLIWWKFRYFKFFGCFFFFWIKTENVEDISLFSLHEVGKLQSKYY